MDLVMPMEVQMLTSDSRVEANTGRITLRYGPLIYNFEKADQTDIDKYIRKGPLTAEWKGDLLDGIIVTQYMLLINLVRKTGTEDQLSG